MAVQDDVLRLAALDQQVVQALVDRNIEKFCQVFSAFRTLKLDLKQRMLDECVVTEKDEVVREVVYKIHRSGDFQSEEMVQKLSKLGGGNFEDDEFSDAEIEELGSKIFYSWFSGTEYVTALIELRPLILHCETSENVKRLVDQIRNCYAFQQYDAAFGLCRTMLEACIRDICVRRALFPELSESAVLYERRKWAELRDRVACGELKEKLKALYERQCRVLHARSAAGAQDAREVFKETLLVIEELYKLHIACTIDAESDLDSKETSN